MWVLEKCEGDENARQLDRPNVAGQNEAASLVKIHFLLCGPSLIVSRKAGPSVILLQGDSSISRQHASITVLHTANNLKNPSVLPEVKLKDLGAKYGTYVNDGIRSDLRIQNERVLVNGDKIRFGMINNIWRLKHQDLVATTSTLQTESKGELQTALLKLGGHLVKDWMPNCSYLVMNRITLTIKVVCALAAACHIVTPEFFTKWADAIMKHTPHPEASKFLPPLQEMSINQSLASFSPNEERRKVLSGKIFLFSSPKQLKSIGAAIDLAGGIPVLLSEENYELVSSLEYLLMQLPSEKNQEPQGTILFQKSQEILQKKGLRVIPEQDVGLAILYRSTETHCNPTFKVSNILKRNGSSSMSQGHHIYATETQDMTQNSMSLTGTRIVPDSGLTSSRKTPAPTTLSTVPPAVEGYPSTSNHSSSSTNASTLMTLDQSCSGKPNPEDKENINVKANKRSRPQTTVCEPPSKRTNRSSNQERIPCEPEPTQPIEIVDEEDISQECDISKFAPKHVSTQKYDKSAKEKLADNVDDKTGILDGGLSTLEPVTGRSIPFEPYTLPSLNVEPPMEDDDISTQPYQIKKEPLSQEEDEPDCHSGKRRRDEEVELDNEDASNWFGKKSRIENTNVKVRAENTNAEMKSERVAVQPTVKQEVRNEDDLFVIPNTSERSKRRAEAKKRQSEERGSGSVNDLFDLPTSSRAERRKKMMKTEEPTPKVLDNKDSNVKDGISSKCPQVPSAKHYVNTAINDKGRNMNTTLNETWISKKGNESMAHANRSPVKAEAVAMETVTKCEPRHGDVAEVADSFERSLVVVQVASLVRRREVKASSTSSTQNQSVGNLKNFKKFRKNSADVSTLPKIIGGKDLVPHDKAEISTRDNWLRENPDVTILLAEQRREENVEVENLFAMAQDPSSRRRGRKK